MKKQERAIPSPGNFDPLGFTNEFLFTLGASDGDLTLSPGDTDLLPAAGAIVIAVFFILQLLQKQQIFPVFLITLISIPGEGSENSPAHQHIGEHEKRQGHRGKLDDRG